MPRKLLFIGDIGVTTGFSRVNEELLLRLNPAEWTPHILGINIDGDPNPIRERLKFIYPASEKGHSYGINRVAPLVNALKPDILVIHQDAWVSAMYLDMAREMGLETLPPTIVYCPPDGPNQPAGVKLEGRVRLVLCPTAFGVREIQKGGYTGATGVLPYGVDTSIFYPGSRREAREWLGFPEDIRGAFVIGRADRNARRKRYDLTIKGWARWWKKAGKPKDAILYLHCVPNDSPGWDLKQLTQYFGIYNQVLWTDVAKMENAGRLPPKEFLRNVFLSWDAHLSTVEGEGFGLVALESAACGVMQVVPRYSAYGEWLDGAADFMPVSSYFTNPGINTIGGVVDPDDVAKAIDRMYTGGDAHSGEAYRQSMGAKALKRATEERFNWDVIAAQFVRHLEAVCEKSSLGSS